MLRLRQTNRHAGGWVYVLHVRAANKQQQYIMYLWVQYVASYIATYMASSQDSPRLMAILCKFMWQHHAMDGYCTNRHGKGENEGIMLLLLLLLIRWQFWVVAVSNIPVKVMEDVPGFGTSIITMIRTMMWIRSWTFTGSPETDNYKLEKHPY